MVSVEWIPFGRVGRPHGVRGEVRVSVFSDVDLPPGVHTIRLTNDKGSQTLTLLHLRQGTGASIASFEEITDRNAAALLAGKEMLVSTEELPPLGQGEFYLHELIDSAAVTAEGESLGRLVRFESTGAHQLAVFDTPHGERLLPVSEKTILRFKRAEREVVVWVPEGLW